MRHFWIMACVAMAAVAAPATSADLRIPPIAERPVPAQSVQRFLEGRALLHILRATFDVVDVQSLPSLVEADARGALAQGVTVEQARELQTALLVEGGYFLTSLTYLLDAGFPNWPDDRSAATYERDARMMLGELPERLVATLLGGEDPIDIFAAAARVYWWTEGMDGPLNGRADFARRDALVDEAIARLAPARVAL